MQSLYINKGYDLREYFAAVSGWLRLWLNNTVLHHALGTHLVGTQRWDWAQFLKVTSVSSRFIEFSLIAS